MTVQIFMSFMHIYLLLICLVFLEMRQCHFQRHCQ